MLIPEPKAFQTTFFDETNIEKRISKKSQNRSKLWTLLDSIYFKTLRQESSGGSAAKNNSNIIFTSFDSVSFMSIFLFPSYLTTSGPVHERGPWAPWARVI